MKLFLILFCVIISGHGSAQSARKLHDKAIVVDGHNDVLTESVIEARLDISKRLDKGHSDLERWSEGGLDVQFFSVWTGEKARNKEGFYQDAVEQIDSLNLIVLRNPQDMILARNYKEVRKGIRQNKFVALIGVEGGHMIEDDLNKLESLFQKDMRYMTLTWNNNNSWATSAMYETGNSNYDTLKRAHGLTEFGKQVVKRMNELGIIVDLSHIGEKTFYDALEVTTKPVMLSHSSVWSICPVFRNVKDDQIRAVAKNKGVICINFYSGFISAEFDKTANYLSNTVRPRFMDSLRQVNPDSVARREIWRQYYRSLMKEKQPTLSQMVDHIDYIVKLVGDDFVGLGSDFDGVSALPLGLEDVSTYPKITEELIARGYSKKSIKKILGGNVMRVMRANFR